MTPRRAADETPSEIRGREETTNAEIREPGPRTTDDGRRTTDDGRRTTDDG
jgi:hypothetical protein